MNTPATPLRWQPPALPPQPGRAFELYDRHEPGYEARLSHTLTLLGQALATHRGQLVQASSLGIEDMVLTDLLHRHFRDSLDRGDVRVATLDTGRLHDSTLQLVDRARDHWGLHIELFAPADTAVQAWDRAHGPWAMRDSKALRQACCQLRKLSPLQEMLAGRSAWLTGLRREQSTHRAEVPDAQADGARTKFNPLAAWRWTDVWHYARVHGVPYNPLHDAFMPSIGCEPCTRPIAVGEDFRAGRWWWEEESARECGLHPPPPQP